MLSRRRSLAKTEETPRIRRNLFGMPMNLPPKRESQDRYPRPRNKANLSLGGISNGIQKIQLGLQLYHAFKQNNNNK